MANEAATGNNCRPVPTQAQAEAGNYKMGRVRVQGLDIRVENVRGSVRSGTSPDGKAWSNRMSAHYGYIAGTRGADGDEVDVFVGPLPESDAVWVINQRDAKGSFDEHKVMVGFATEDQARSAYQHSYDRNWRGLQSIVPVSLAQLKWWLRNGNKARAISSDQLPHEGESTMDQVRWSSAADPLNTTLPRVIYDMRRNDAGGLLLDAISVSDLMTDPDIEGRLELDAMVVEVGLLQRKMEQLRMVMKAAAGTVQPLDFTIADPVKMRGTMQIAVIFAMDDGQAITVWFHNPDTTPNKLTPMDELVSWKWMLNKKDVTIVVAPERGRDLNAREVARRIMKLVEKNTEAFKRANARSAELAAQHAALDAEIPVLEAEVAKLQDQVEVARIAKADGEIAKLPAVVEPTVPAATGAEQSLTALAQELASILQGQGYASYSDRRAKMMSEFNLSTREALDLGTLVEGIVGPEAMTLARANFDPFTQGQKAWHRGESAIAPEGLTDDQAKQWLAGWDERRANNEAAQPDPVAPVGEVVGEATEVVEEPVAELTGDELGSFADTPEGLDGLRGAAYAYLMDDLRSMGGIFSPALDADVFVRREGAKKMRSLGADPRKLRIVKAIPQIIGRGKKFKPSTPSYASEPGVVAYHYLRCVVRLGGEPIAVRTVIKEQEDGAMVWDNAVHPVDAIFDSAKGNGSTEVDPLPDTTYKPGASADADQVAGDRPYVPPHQFGILDDAGSVVKARWALNIFIEGEGPEFLELDETATAVEIVDSAYLFAQATERFKTYIAETVGESDYSMFATAKAMDMAAKDRGAAISWDVEDVGVMDAVDPVLDSVSYSVKVVFNEETPIHARQFGAKQTCFVDWGIYGGVALVEASDEDRKEFGGGTFRIGKGQTQYESIVRVDPKGMRLYFVDNKHYEDTMEVRWDSPVSLKRLVVQNKEKFEAAYRTPILDGAALDRVDPDSKRSVVGRIYRDGIAVGVATVSGDGKAMVYLGGLGGERVKDPSGAPAPRGSDPEFLVKWLLEPNPAPEPEPAVALEDGNVAVLRAILAGDSDSSPLSLTLATIAAAVNALNDAGLLVGDVEQLAQDVITHWATLDEKVNG